MWNKRIIMHGDLGKNDTLSDGTLVGGTKWEKLKHSVMQDDYQE